MPARPVRPKRSIAWSLAGALLLLSPAFAAKPQRICTPQVRCSDHRGCPDLSLDLGVLLDPAQTWMEFHTFAPTDCAVVEGMAQAGTRKMLLFATETNNLGPGGLELGDPADHPAWFEFSPCHGHYHIKDYADYRLWTPAGYAQWIALRGAQPDLCASEVLAANPALASQVVQTNKLGLCFYDVLLMGTWDGASQVCPRSPDPRTYVSCDFAGLGVCWADVYNGGLYGIQDGQWVDVTDLPDGEYVLENESNATRLIAEADYTNNSIAIRVLIKGKKMSILGPA
ncbi:MAG TPA: lysyl oxidase family protein [Candidatus Polarisedimenticolia bacterium]|nr:lysyl oxidase family protein [Candidatus Polarisedimenticolia bacterium]